MDFNTYCIATYDKLMSATTNEEANIILNDVEKVMGALYADYMNDEIIANALAGDIRNFYVTLYHNLDRVNGTNMPILDATKIKVASMLDMASKKYLLSSELQTATRKKLFEEASK